MEHWRINSVTLRALRKFLNSVSEKKGWNMIRQLLSITLIVLLSMSACQQADKLTKSEQNEIRDEVRKMLDDYFSVIRSRGMMGEFGYLDNSPEFFWVPPGYSSWISYDSVAAVLKTNAPVFTLVDNVWDSLRVDPLTREFATYTGTLHGTMIDTAGKVTKVSAIETGVVVKRNDGWKLLRGQTSLLPVDGQ